MTTVTAIPDNVSSQVSASESSHLFHASPLADLSMAVPPFSIQERKRIDSTRLLSASKNAEAVRKNKQLHARKSGIDPVHIRTDLQRYIDFSAVEKALRRYNATNPSTQVALGATPVDAVFVEAIHQFQLKCFFDSNRIHGIADFYTLDSLGITSHKKLNSYRRKNQKALGRLKKVHRKQKIADLLDEETPAFTPDTWFNGIVNPSFLGHVTNRGLHTVLIRRFRKAERYLLSLPAYRHKTPVQLGRALGFGPGRELHKGFRPTAATESMHTFGLAVDIRYSGNPFVRRADFTRVLKRASLLISGTQISQSTVSKYFHSLGTNDRLSTREVYRILSRHNEDFKQYLQLRGNRTRITAILEERRNAGTPGIFSRGESTARAATRWANRINSDLTAMRSGGSVFRMQGGGLRNPLNGFLNLHEDLVIALRDKGCLAWGAVDLGPSSGGSGDIMHFDARVCGLGDQLAGTSKKGQNRVKKGHPCLPCEKPEKIALRFTLAIFDENKKPLDGGRLTIFQKGQQPASASIKKGRARIKGIDPEKPFKLDVEGRVCSIVKGAVLLTDEEDTQYGGSRVDWDLADDQVKQEHAEVFWRKYRKYRTEKPEGPSRFWQHEHLTCRWIRLRKSYIPAPGKKTHLAILKAIPLQIRTGPLVRFTSHQTAVIWTELETPGLVKIMYGKRAGRNKSQTAYGSTIRVGGRYFAAIPLRGLSEDTAYTYTVELAPIPSGGLIPTGEEIAKKFPALSHSVLKNIHSQLRSSSFSANQWLSFRTLRQKYDRRFRFAFGSCRKWPNDVGHDYKRNRPKSSGKDMLGGMGEWLARADREKEWPRFMLMLGDQIYADDIGTRQGWAMYEDRYSTKPPGRKGKTEGAWAGRFSSRIKEFWRKNPRHIMLRTRYFNFNHKLWKPPVERKDITWDKRTNSFPSAGETRPKGNIPTIHASDFAEFAYLYESAWNGPDDAKKVLANIPSFMTFDDHEVTDDWNYDFKWIDMVYNPPSKVWDLWPDTITDALISYWIYQGWCNMDPDVWDRDPRTRILLAHQTTGKDALPALRKRVKQAVPSKQRLRKNKDETPPRPLDWFYSLPMQSPRFLAMDLRTDRQVIKGVSTNMSDNLISPRQQDWLINELSGPSDSAAFVLSSVPMLLPGLLAEASRWDKVTVKLLGLIKVGEEKFNEEFRRRKDVEHWPTNQSWESLKYILSQLSNKAPKLKTLVALSGDVHFSYNMLGRLTARGAAPFSGRIKRRDNKGNAFPYLLQLVSSPLKNRLSPGSKREMRMFVEQDSISSKIRGKVPFKHKTLRERFFKHIFIKGWFTWKGMELRMGGFRRIKNRGYSTITSNAVTIVDVKMNTSRGTGVDVTAQYLTEKARRPTIRFRYKLTGKGPRLITPKFQGKRRRLPVF